MRQWLRHLPSVLLWLAADAAAAPGMLVNANIRTLDPAMPVAEALAWDSSGRIVAVGAIEAVAAKAGDVPRTDAGGRTVLPGLIDAHAHLLSLGHALLRADLAGAASKQEIVERLQAFARELPPDAWLLGRGWDQNRWPEREFPTAADLDAAFPERPVWLIRVDGHAGWANSAALRHVQRDLAGDWQPDGGRIMRVDGRATGVLVDAAMEMVAGVVPAPDAATRALALERAMAEAAKFGLTGVHDMGVSLEDLALMRRFAEQDRLTLRITAYADGDADALTALCAFGPLHHRGDRLRMHGVKLYADGALGSRGAMLLADYSDEPGHRGLPVTSPAALEAAMRKAQQCGLQVATHAIGDAANRSVLDLYAQVFGATAARDHRWRIEHAQIVDPADIPRFRLLGVLASMQPTHATSDMAWVPQRLGPHRLAGAYAWKRFVDAGVGLPLGSDFPVEAVDPMLGLYAAITRQDANGTPPGGWLPDQKLTLEQAVHGFTVAAAHAGFAERDVGRLAPGLHADFIVLDSDPFALGAPQLRSLRVRSTWLDGVAVYQAR